MALYSRILVPLDGSELDLAAFERAEEIARLSGAEIVLLRVAHYHTRDSRRAEIDEAREILREACLRFGRRGLAVRTVIGQGEVADAIVDKARELGADLVVMGAHGHGALRRALEGSVPDRVRHKSEVPLLLVRATSRHSLPNAARVAPEQMASCDRYPPGL
jgi:nucleotide-binding universal stress UspA family protein